MTEIIDDLLRPTRSVDGAERSVVSARTVLGVALLIDMVFVVLHVAYVLTDWSNDERFLLEWDRGFSEWFQYGKTGVLSVVLWILAARERALVLVIWATLFLYIILDDSLALHEQVGSSFGEWLARSGVEGRLATSDAGQLIFAAALGALLLPSLLYGHARAIGPARRISRGLVALGVAFVFCSVVADALHALLAEHVPETPFVLLEEGGELVIMSAMLAYVWSWLAFAEPGGRA